jgi:hypothetical protein
MSELTKQALKVDNNMSFPNNNAGLITPTALRGFNENMIDSTVNQAVYTADSGSWNQQINALEQFTASASGLTTGSLLITASFNNSTRNLTFTKGDSSTFAVNIPDASGSVLPSGVVSGSSQITALGFVSSSVTGSSVITASFSGNTLTFTKGNGTTFGVVIPDVSGSTINTGSFITNIQNNPLTPLTLIYDNATSSTNVTLDLPSGVVSGSSQVSYTGLSNIPSGIVSGAAQVTPLLPSGVVSGSSQLTASYDQRYALSGSGGGGSTFPYVGNAEITGSLIVSSSGQSVTLYAQNLGQNSGVIVNGRLDVNGQFSAQVLNVNGVQTNVLESNATPQIFVNNSLVLRPTYGDVKLEVTGSTILSGSLTASLQEGYTWVGDSTGVSKPFPTSSFGGGGTGNGFPFSGSAVITGSLAVSETVKSQVYINPQTIDGFTIPTGNNAMLVGPVAVSGSIVVEGNSNLIVLSQVTSSSTPLPSGVVSGSSQLTASYDLRYALSGSGTTINTGSFATTGSNTFIGNQTITGSLAISSSTSCSVIVPNGFNDEGFLINGNLRVTNGSLRVDQSIITAGIYTQTLARNSNDPINVDNSLNIRPNAPGVSATNVCVSGSVYVSQSLYTSDLYVGGNKQFNGGEFFSTTTQSGSAGVSGSITFNNSGSVSGISLVNNTQLTIANSGTYNIQFSAQVETTGGADSFYAWFKKNGNNIANSATKLVLANNTAQVMTVNILDDAIANDYYELAYQNNNGHAVILAEVASGNIPAIPSVIATVTQVR